MWNKNIDRGRILIVGGQEEARSLANSLMKKDYRVTVVNRDYEACEKLAENGRLHVIFGDGSKKFILEEAQAGSCRGVIALTGSDEKNLVICEMCKEYFGPQCGAGAPYLPVLPELSAVCGRGRLCGDHAGVCAGKGVRGSV